MANNSRYNYQHGKKKKSGVCILESAHPPEEDDTSFKLEGNPIDGMWNVAKVFGSTPYTGKSPFQFGHVK